MYEKAAIKSHLERSNTDPLTRQPLLNKWALLHLLADGHCCICQPLECHLLPAAAAWANCCSNRVSACSPAHIFGPTFLKCSC